MLPLHHRRDISEILWCSTWSDLMISVLKLCFITIYRKIHLFSHGAIKLKHLVFDQFQPNHERNPIEEMLAAEDSGEFLYSPPEENDEEESPQQQTEVAPISPVHPPKSPKSPKPVSCRLTV